MMRIDTAASPTQMIKMEPIWQTFIHKQLIHYAVCYHIMAFPPDFAMTFTCVTTSPDPAASLIDADLLEDALRK
jgi:hypothetical protein